MKVRNLQEYSRPPKCGCGSWIHHWENGSGEDKWLCCATGCLNDADRGGHVQLKDSEDRRWYIIPICAKHNNKFGKEFEIDDDTALVPVGKSAKCGQQHE
jgi:hypothetical protein